MKGITRRNLAALALALPGGAQQSAPLPSTPDEELAAAKEQFRSSADQLAKVPLPMATEPATRFKA